MKKEFLVREKVIAVLVFVMWSIGVVFFPGIRFEGIAATVLAVFLLYVVLHVCLFWLSVRQLRALVDLTAAVRRSMPVSVVLRTAMYAYVLLTVAVSIVLTLHTFFVK